VISRLPVRFNFDNRYFEDRWEGLPLEGYGKWFSRMLESKNISVIMNQDYLELKDDIEIPTIYTGPMDKYFNYSEGHLGWRTLDFEFETLEMESFQGTSVMNYADLDVHFTRIHEFKHLHPERNHGDRTVISREFSRKANKNDEPYYPINSSEDREKVEKYRAKIKFENEKSIYFGGRLGTYKYLDMHMAIGSALSFYENQLKAVLR
jgi:UDP-galactopyranose mutase